MDFHKLLINQNLTVRKAMEMLAEINPKIVFTVDGSKLTGALTDGDVRRHLLKGGKIDDCCIAAANHNPLCAHSVDEAVDLYSARNFIAIPIVDLDYEIKDVFVGGRQEIVASPLNIPVVINAGGRGTRLDPFTRVLPKPLIPVGELPIIEHIMQHFEAFSCNRFHVIVNYKKQLIKGFFNDSEKPYDVSWYDESKPLGTGGGLSLLKGKMHETFFFTNCDILLQSDYSAMLKFHRENNNAITMVCAYKNVTVPYGVIEMGENGTIEKMTEKPEMSFLTNTGMYIVEPYVLDDIEDDVSVGFPDIVELEMKKGRNVRVFPVPETEWLDMGQMPELEKMRERLYGND